MDAWHAVLLTIVVVQFFISFLGLVWAVFRELYHRRLVDSQASRQEQYSLALNEIIKDVSAILTEVTHTMSAAMKAVDGSNLIAKDTQTNLINAFNQLETRLMNWLQRVEKMPSIHNNFNGHNTQGDVGNVVGGGVDHLDSDGKRGN